MGVAANMHLGKGEGILAASHAIELGILFFSLLFIGPGRYSVDKG
jgi:putative oxidoreductase